MLDLHSCDPDYSSQFCWLRAGLFMSAGSHDKDTFIASSIAQLLFPDEEVRSEEEHTSPNSPPGTEYFGSVLTARSRYRELLVPLRKCLDVPEVRQCYAPVKQCMLLCDVSPGLGYHFSNPIHITDPDKGNRC